MAQGLMHYLREAWKKPDEKLMRERTLEWRKGNSIERVERPLRLDRAKSLGYSAKPGFVVVSTNVNVILCK